MISPINQEICSSCNKNLNEENMRILKIKVDRIRNIKYINLLNDDILIEICSYLINPFHIIEHTRKSRIKPPHLPEDEDGEYYWQETKNICTGCFQYGIDQSLIFNNTLPHLRRDVYFFLNENISNDEKDVVIDKMKDYFLPKYYIIDYYRNKVINKKDKFNYITEK